MHSEILPNYLLKLELGFEAVIIYDETASLYALGLRKPDSVPEFALAMSKEPDKIKWQSRFPLNDIQRLNLNDLPFVRIKE